MRGMNHHVGVGTTYYNYFFHYVIFSGFDIIFKPFSAWVKYTLLYISERHTCVIIRLWVFTYITTLQPNEFICVEYVFLPLRFLKQFCVFFVLRVTYPWEDRLSGDSFLCAVFTPLSRLNKINRISYLKSFLYYECKYK